MYLRAEKDALLLCDEKHNKSYNSRTPKEPNYIPLIVWLRYSQPECFKRLTCEFLMRSCPVHSWGWTNLDRQGEPGVITRKKCCHFLKLSRFTFSPLSSKFKSKPKKVFEIKYFKYTLQFKKIHDRFAMKTEINLMIQELQDAIVYHSYTGNQNVSKGSPVSFLWGRAQCIPEAGLTWTDRVNQA